MTYTQFIIKKLVKHETKYLGHNDKWDDLYGPWGARKFESEKEAEEYLLKSFHEKFWGGMFAIEKYYVSK